MKLWLCCPLCRYSWHTTAADPDPHPHRPWKEDQNLHCHHQGGQQVSKRQLGSSTISVVGPVQPYMLCELVSPSFVVSSSPPSTSPSPPPPPLPLPLRFPLPNLLQGCCWCPHFSVLSGGDLCVAGGCTRILGCRGTVSNACECSGSPEHVHV